MGSVEGEGSFGIFGGSMSLECVGKKVFGLDCRKDAPAQKLLSLLNTTLNRDYPSDHDATSDKSMTTDMSSVCDCPFFSGPVVGINSDIQVGVPSACSALCSFLFCALSSKFEAMFVVHCLSDLRVSSACPHLLHASCAEVCGSCPWKVTGS